MERVSRDYLRRHTILFHLLSLAGEGYGRRGLGLRLGFELKGKVRVKALVRVQVKGRVRLKL